MQSSVPRVSALVTTFNHERFIEGAIDSLLAQTYPDIEIIVVDDGSHDRTLELASSYRSKGVRVLEGPRKGPSYAMNMAMSEASGDIYLLQSGDDMSAPMRAERQVQELAKADVHANFPMLINAEGNTISDCDFNVFFRMHSVGDMKLLFKSLYEDGNFLCASSVALRRTAWEALGGFHGGLLQLQDYEYWMRALVKGFSLTVSPERLVYYRIHNTNLSSVENDTRTLRELGAIFRLLESEIPTEFLLSALYGRSFDGIAADDADREIFSSLLFLRHKSEAVRQIGIEKLLYILDDAQLSAALESKFGLSHRDIFRILLHT